MKISINEFVTMDGVVQGPGGADEDTSGGFERGGWLMPYAMEEAFGEVVEGWFGKTSALLLGRNTYEMMKAHWPQVTTEDLTTTTLNTGRKYVVSTTLSENDDDWENTTVIRSLDDVRRPKDEGGDGELQVHGSAQLARDLHEAGLVDIYRFLMAPVVVGSGKRIFDTGPASGFTAEVRPVGSAGLTSITLTPEEFRTGMSAVIDGVDTVVPDEA